MRIDRIVVLGIFDYQDLLDRGDERSKIRSKKIPCYATLSYRIVSFYAYDYLFPYACCGMCVMKQKETTERALELDPYIHSYTNIRYIDIHVTCNGKCMSYISIYHASLTF